MPSFVIDFNLNYFTEKEMEFFNNPKNIDLIWIIKSAKDKNSSRIFLENKFSDLFLWAYNMKNSNIKNKNKAKNRYVISQYLENPYLINNRKINIRIYIYVVCYNPLFIVYHRGGFVKLAKFEYDLKDI